MYKYKQYKLDFSSEGSVYGGKPYDFSIDVNPSINVGQDAEICLANVSVWNSLKNISVKLGNNVVRYSPDNGVSFKLITLQEGSYSIPALSTAIQSGISGYGDIPTNIVLLPNYNTLKVDIICINNYQLDLSFGNLYVLLGWSNVLVSSSGSGTLDANVNLGVQSWNVYCNLVAPETSYSNGSSSSSIFSFSPNVGSGELINITPQNLIFLPIASPNIGRVQIRLTDQIGRTLDNLSDNEATSIVFIVRSSI